MATLARMTEAAAYIRSIDDPIIKNIVASAFALIYTSNEPFEGEFDAHYYVRLVHLLCRDPDKLKQMLQGTYADPLGQ